MNKPAPIGTKVRFLSNYTGYCPAWKKGTIETIVAVSKYNNEKWNNCIYSLSSNPTWKFPIADMYLELVESKPITLKEFLEEESE